MSSAGVSLAERLSSGGSVGRFAGCIKSGENALKLIDIKQTEFFRAFTSAEFASCLKLEFRKIIKLKEMHPS